MARHDDPPNELEHDSPAGFTRVLVAPMAVHVHENEAQYFDDDNY